MSLTRTDCHRPSTLVSSDYQYICSKNHQALYIGCNPLQSFMDHIQTTSGKFSAINGGNCDICGVAMQSYCIYYHQKTNEYIKVGEICASKIDADVFDRLRTEEKNLLVRAGKGKAVKLLSEMGIDCEEISNLVSEADNYILAKKPIELINSVLATIIKSGKVSDKQVSFLHNLVQQVKTAGKKEAQIRKDAENIPEWQECRQAIQAVVVKVTQQQTDFGEVHKVMAKTDVGQVVMFNCPSSVKDTSVLLNSKVEVTLTLQPTQDKVTGKKTFAFGKRPSNLKII